MLKIDNNINYEFFDVLHDDTSLGVSINKNGKREITYTGDLSIKEMRKKDLIKYIPQLLDTNTLIIENSIPSSMSFMTPVIDLFGGRHSSIDDIEWLVNNGNDGDPINIDHLVLVHTLGHPTIRDLTIDCNILENDIENHFGDKPFDSHYLTACRTLFEVKDNIMTPKSI